jgi:hypothetical protein
MWKNLVFASSFHEHEEILVGQPFRTVLLWLETRLLANPYDLRIWNLDGFRWPFRQISFPKVNQDESCTESTFDGQSKLHDLFEQGCPSGRRSTTRKTGKSRPWRYPRLCHLDQIDVGLLPCQAV